MEMREREGDGSYGTRFGEIPSDMTHRVRAEPDTRSVLTPPANELHSPSLTPRLLAREQRCVCALRGTDIGLHVSDYCLIPGPECYANWLGRATSRFVSPADQARV